MLIARTATEVSILVPREELTRAVKAVLETGVFHPKPVEAEGEEAGGERAQLQRLVSEAENLAQRIRAYLDVIGELPEPIETSMGEVRDWVEKAQEVIREAAEIDSKLDPMLRQLTELRTHGSEYAEAAAAARAYRWLDFDLEELRKLEKIKVRLFRVDATHLDRFRVLAEEEPVLVAIAEDYEPAKALVVVVYPAEHEMVVNHVAGETNAMEIEMPSGVPSNLAKAAEYFDRLERQLIEEIRRERRRLRELLAKLLTVREALRVLIAAARTRLFVVLNGYVPRSDLRKFTDRVLRETNNTAVVAAAGYVKVTEETALPSVLKVPRVLKPFEMLLTSYGVPKAGSISPLLIMAITFPLIFGMAFPDAGHGLVLLLLGIYMLRRGEFLGIAKGEGVRKLGALLLYLGVSAMIFGFLAAEFFGPVGGEPLISFWCHLGFPKPPYATPLFAAHVDELKKTNPQKLMELCPKLATIPTTDIVRATVFFSMYVSFLLGSFLLTLSSIFAIYNYAAMGEKGEAIVSGLSKTLVFGGVFIAFLAGLPYLPADAIVVAARILGAVVGMKNPNEILAGIAASVSNPSAYASLVYVVAAMIYGGLVLAFFGKIAEVLAHGGGFGSALGQAALELFDLLLIAVGNTLSFLRIFALSLAHSGLMYGFYIISKLGGVVGFWPIYILGNLLVIGMESIVAFAHTLRLHYYEMFSKFFVTGVPFEPVRAYARLA